MFTAQRTLEQGGQDFYTDLKARLIKYGRSPDEIKVLPGIVPFIADTEEEAKALEQSFTDLISPEYSLRQLSNMVGVDLTEHSLDAPLPPLPDIDRIQGNKSRYQLVKDLAESENLTVRELIGKLGGGRGHRTFAGTPEQVADELTEWFDKGAADGFNIMPPYLPEGSRCSSTGSCRFCRRVGSSGPNTRNPPCGGVTTASIVRRIGSRGPLTRQK